MAKIPSRVNTSELTVRKNLKEAEELQNNIVRKKEEGAISEIEIQSILEPHFHDRRYIEKSSILELSKSIEAVGLLYPIVVRRLSSGELERIIGYRRIEAMKILGRTKIPAIILENISDAQASLLMTTENLQREDLSVYDSTLAILDYLSLALGIPQEKCISLLNRFKNFTTNQVKNLNETDEQMYEQVEEILRKTGKIGVSGLINRIGMLNMHSLIKEKLSSGELAFTNAQIINKLKEEGSIRSVLDEVISSRLSKRETTMLVNTYFEDKEDVKRENIGLKIEEALNLANKRVKKMSTARQEEIEVLIEKMMALLQKD